MKRLLTALLFTCIIGISYHADAAVIDLSSATVTAGSTYTGSSPENAIDGTSAGWNAGWWGGGNFDTGSPAPAASLTWLDIDLQDLYDITSVTATIGASGVIFNILTREQLTDAWTLFGSGSTTRYDNITNVIVLGDATARYVRYDVVGGYDWANVAELTLTGTPNAVPIPAAIWLFGTGLIALLGFARRKV